jgi:hypothetical protein
LESIEKLVLDRLLGESGEKYLIGIAHAARLLGITRGTALNWRWQGKFPLPVVKLGKKVFVRATDLSSFLAGNGAGTMAAQQAEPPPVIRRRGRPKKIQRRADRPGT